MKAKTYATDSLTCLSTNKRTLFLKQKQNKKTLHILPSPPPPPPNPATITPFMENTGKINYFNHCFTNFCREYNGSKNSPHTEQHRI